ncbi:hypothetical protein GCM10009596_23430 [Arthrobacter rhombi]
MGGGTRHLRKLQNGGLTMPSSEEMRTLGSKISQLIQTDSPGMSTLHTDVDDHAFRGLVNMIAFALNGLEPEYFSSCVSYAADGVTAHIEFAVFTERHVIYYSGPISKTGPEVRVLPRAGLTALTILNAPEMVPNNSWNNYDGNASYSLTYGDHAKFPVPLREEGHSDDVFANSLLPRLMEDLAS